MIKENEKLPRRGGGREGEGEKEKEIEGRIEREREKERIMRPCSVVDNISLVITICCSGGLNHTLLAAYICTVELLYYVTLTNSG